MSITAVTWPILSALCKASLFLSVDAGLWQPINESQKEFLTNYYIHRSELNKFNEKEMRSWVSTSHEELNRILKSEGFDIELEPLDGGFGVVSILDVFVQWLRDGKKTEIYARKGDEVLRYSGVHLEEGVSSFSTIYDERGACIETKTGDKVWMIIPQKKDVEALHNGLSLLAQIGAIRSRIDPNSMKQNEVFFPMVDLNQENDISWLKEMRLPDKSFISQAKQQTKFKMDHTGAHVKSAVAIGVLRCCLTIKPVPVIINEPFYLWIERPGVSHPVFAGYITHEHWKDPQGLNMQ